MHHEGDQYFGSICGVTYLILKEIVHYMRSILYVNSLSIFRSSFFPQQINVPSELIVKKYPHFMDRKQCYHSKSILGRIYDEAVKVQSENVGPVGTLLRLSLSCRFFTSMSLFSLVAVASMDLFFSRYFVLY